jgi:hypothetical protein
LAIDTNLLPFDALRASRLAIDTNLLPFDALRTRNLLALCAHLHALHTLRSSLLPLNADLLTLRALRTRLLALDALLLSLLAAAAAMRSGSCGRRDRQRGNACGEKHPSHQKISFRTAKNGQAAAPFQRVNGWNLRSTALG